jgi:hypothetical protein
MIPVIAGMMEGRRWLVNPRFRPATPLSATDYRPIDREQAQRYPPYMEVYMELSKKTTVLFTPALHRRLQKLAALRGTSMGDLVREACEQQYGLVEPEERLEAVRELAGMSLPVGNVTQMKQESVPASESLLP